MIKFPFIKDPKTGKPSVTLTVFIFGFIVAILKLLFSGIEIIDKVKMSEFSGIDFGAVVGSLGAIYNIRKNKTIKEKQDTTDA